MSLIDCKQWFTALMIFFNCHEWITTVSWLIDYSSTVVYNEKTLLLSYHIRISCRDFGHISDRIRVMLMPRDSQISNKGDLEMPMYHRYRLRLARTKPAVLSCPHVSSNSNRSIDCPSIQLAHRAKPLDPDQS